METTSLPGRVQLSAAAAELLQREMPADLALQPRGQIVVKGKVGTRIPIYSCELQRKLALGIHRQLE